MENSKIKELKNRLGADKVIDSPEGISVYRIDASKIYTHPLAVVLPETIEDIVEVVKFASREKIPLYPRGAGSGLTGGAVPLQDGILLVFTRMNKIIRFDEDNMTVEVEPGIVTAQLNAAAAKLGLYYPPDPASSEFSTIGGNLAECAGGLRAVKYGVTRDYVLQLTVVTMAGETLTFGAGTHKSVTGYDVCRLLVGSEGTLAIIVKAVLKLIPKPLVKKTMLATFKDDIAPIKSAIEILRNKITPCAMEYITKEALSCAYEYTKDEKIKTSGGSLLIEFDGHPDSVAREIEAASRIISESSNVNIHIASDTEESESLWEIRKCLSPAMYHIAPTKINEDICVPRSKISEMVGLVKKIAAEFGVKIVIFAHIGDGNFHLNFMFDEKNEEESERIRCAVRKTFETAISLGGTLSGEHGIGIKKMEFLPLEYNSAEVGIFKKIKQLWDPDNLLNPGKIF